MRRDLFLAFYDGGRDVSVWYVRLHVFEDIAVAYLIAVLSGTYPSSHNGCTAVCFALLAVAMAHLSYVLIVRPYMHDLDQLLGVINAFIGLSIAVCGVWSRLAKNGTETATLAMGYCLLIANAFYFAQLIVLAALALLHEYRTGKRVTHTEEAGDPLLRVPSGTAVTLANDLMPSIA